MRVSMNENLFQVFLGLLGCCQFLIACFLAKATHSLYNLIKGGAMWDWDVKFQDNFDQV